jgi:CDP-diacylglycerol--glycerol-3-phosphate 3-phosphatidyltransferase
MTTANKITIARILCIPAFVMMAIYYGRSVRDHDPQPWQRWCAIAIFALAAASDGLDGYIARHYNQRSKLGVILDPIADKGLMFAAIITLTFFNWDYEFPVWFPVLVITRDLVVVIGVVVLHMLHGSVQVHASWTGKCATALQMAAIIIVGLQLNFFTKHFILFGHPVQVKFLDLPVWLAGIFTAISGFGLVVDGIAQLQSRGHGEGGFTGGTGKGEKENRNG